MKSISTTHANEIDDLNRLLDQYARAVGSLDLDLAEQIWSKTHEISFIHPRGHQVGWEDIKQSFYIQTMGLFIKRDLRIKDVSIRILGKDAAWADFYWDFYATFKDGQALHTTGRETQVWAKESDGWKIVHVHYSGVPTTGKREGF